MKFKFLTILLCFVFMAFSPFLCDALCAENSLNNVSSSVIKSDDARLNTLQRKSFDKKQSNNSKKCKKSTATRHKIIDKLIPWLILGILVL